MDQPSHAMERLKEHGNGYAVWRVTNADGEVTTLKSWPLLFKTLLTLPVGMAQPQRQARGTRRLQALGVPTPAIVSGPKRVGSTVQLELRWIEGRTGLELLRARDAEPAALLEAAERMGTMVATIAAGGFMHRDLKLSNIIVEQVDGKLHPWLIDTVGVRRCMSTSQAVYRMLERLLVEIRREPDLVDRMRLPVVRGALRSLSRSTRRAVCVLLRSHR